MADTKISALPASTTPLAGTEVLPLVQSGVTRQVSVAELTTGRVVNSAGGTFTDNFVQGTAGKGVNFTANTPLAGMTSRLLNWYEEGTWTPSQGAGLTVVGTFSSTGKYTRVGRQVTVVGTLNGSTSISITGAAMCSLPIAASDLSMGNAMNNAGTANTTTYVAGISLFAVNTMAPTTRIYFSITYTV